MGAAVWRTTDRLWRTKLGVLVEERARKIGLDGVVKVAGYRHPTGGFHGWLRLDKLTAVTKDRT